MLRKEDRLDQEIIAIRHFFKYLTFSGNVHVLYIKFRHMIIVHVTLLEGRKLQIDIKRVKSSIILHVYKFNSLIKFNSLMEMQKQKQNMNKIFMFRETEVY